MFTIDGNEASVEVLVLVFLAGMAGYYAGRYLGYREGEATIMGMFRESADAASAEAEKARFRRQQPRPLGEDEYVRTRE